MPKCCGIGFSLRFDLKLHELQNMLVVPDSLGSTDAWQILPLNVRNIYTSGRIYLARHRIQVRVDDAIYSQYKILRKKCRAAGVFDV